MENVNIELSKVQMNHEVSNMWIGAYIGRTGSADGWDTQAIYGWHITSRKNVEKILTVGLHSTQCSSWMSDGRSRPWAVYFFCDFLVARDSGHAEALDIDDPVIIRVEIPASDFSKIKFDASYNMFEASGNCALRYLDDIPAEWCTLVA